ARHAPDHRAPRRRRRAGGQGPHHVQGAPAAAGTAAGRGGPRGCPGGGAPSRRGGSCPGHGDGDPEGDPVPGTRDDRRVRRGARVAPRPGDRGGLGDGTRGHRIPHPRSASTGRRLTPAHLAAVSGANTTYVVGAVLMAAAAAGAGRRGRIVAAGLALVGFVAVVGPEPAVLRAAGTGAIGLAALGARRSGRPLAALSAVVLLVVVLDPGTASGEGLVVTVCASAAVVLAA